MYQDQEVLWTSKSDDKSAKDTVLLVQDDGHAAILSNGERVWYSYRQKDRNTDKDRLVVGEWLAINQPLVSSSGKLRLELQKDGNFVLSQGTQKLWSVKVAPGSPTDPVRVTLRDDDNLCIGSDDKSTWASNTRRKRRGGKAVLRLTESNDGGAAVLESDGVIIWSTKSSLIQNWERKVSFSS